MNLLAALLAALLVLSPFSRVAQGADLRVLTSFLPMYLFTRNVVGDAPGVTVEMMLPASLGCPHDYSLSPGDMRKIAEADLFIANGFGMEDFLGAPVRRANPKIRVVETASSVIPLRAGGDPHGHPGGGRNEVNTPGSAPGTPSSRSAPSRRPFRMSPRETAPSSAGTQTHTSADSMPSPGNSTRPRDTSGTGTS